jgi:VCBS repeat-containing protein
VANDADVDGDALTITHIDGVAITAGGASVTVAGGQVSLGADGITLTYAPAADYHGSPSFTYTVSDGNLSATATVSGTVTAVNDTPVVAADSFTTPEDTAVTITPVANDADVDGDALTITHVDGVAITAGGASVTVAGGQVSLGADGITLTYAPAADYHGSPSFTYTVSDGSLSATATLSGTVTAVNDAPTVSVPDPSGSGKITGQAVSTRISTPEDTPLTGSVMPDDVDAGDTVTAALQDAPAHGTVTVQPDGTYTYVPSGDYHGSDRFTIVVSDGQGGTATAEVVVEVTPVNDAPVVVADEVSGPADQPLVLRLLDNDTDVDGDALRIVSATAASGTVIIQADGSLVYRAASPDVRADVIRYVVSDGQGGQVEAVVRLTLTPPAGGAGVPSENPEPTDASRADASLQFIQAEGAVLQTLAQISDLGSLQGLRADGAVVATVNRIQALNGAFGREVNLERRVEQWLGSSLQIMSGQGGRQIAIEVDTEVRRDTVQVSVASRGTGRAAVAEFQFLAVNGRPLPSGIHVDPRGVVTIPRVPGVERMTMLVRALRTDGTVTEERLEIDVSNGVVRVIDARGVGEDASGVRGPVSGTSLLSAELELAMSAHEHEREALADALGSSDTDADWVARLNG